MHNPLHILDDVRIASPCTADWEQMTGDERVRHCAQCDQKVYDLSTLSRSEAERLVTSSQKVCVRLYRRPDGRVITRDCLAGRLLLLKRVSRRALLMTASWLGLSWLKLKLPQRPSVVAGGLEAPRRQPKLELPLPQPPTRVDQALARVSPPKLPADFLPPGVGPVAKPVPLRPVRRFAPVTGKI